VKTLRMLALIAGTSAALAASVPTRPAYADGAASTRNLILLGAGAAATYLIVEHNRKVHEREAAMAEQNAQSAQQANNAWAAYRQEHKAYLAEAQAVSALKREVAYQHRVVQKQQQELASLGAHTELRSDGHGDRVAMVSYGWGQI
jgi:predicted metal-dependent hydrolase